MSATYSSEMPIGVGVGVGVGASVGVGVAVVGVEVGSRHPLSKEPISKTLIRMHDFLMVLILSLLNSVLSMSKP